MLRLNSKKNKNKPKEPKRLLEVDYPQELIRKLTPYLDDITYPSGEKNIKPNLRQRSYAWYYCFNGGNKTDAYRRAYFSDYHKGRAKLIPRDNLNVQCITTGGSSNYKKIYIREFIRLIRVDIEQKIKADIPQTLLEQLQIQATYDPAMFITPTGKAAFTEWEEIPPAYRCCVLGIDSTRYGKDGKLCETKIKLVDRATARKELLGLAPDLLQPNKVELIHKTIDKDGNETGIDYSKLSDDELKAIVAANKVN